MSARRSSAPSLASMVDSAAAEARGAEELAARRPSGSPEGGPRTVALRRLGVRAGDNPRKSFDRGRLEELAETIEAHGVVQPLAVEPDGESGGYRVIQGERRFRALGILLEEGRIGEEYPVPVYVRTDLDGESRLTAALVENLQRQDLNPVEEAEAFAVLRDEFGRSTAEIARGVGRSQRHVQQRLQLLALSPEVRAALLAGEIPASVARVLAGAPEALQDSALEHYRAAPGSLQNEQALRRHMRARLVPVERACFPLEVYEEEHGGPIWVTETGERDPGARGRYFADPELFLRLQKEALRARRRELGERWAWVETIEGRRLPEHYEVVEGPGQADPGDGVVILLQNGLYEVEVIEGVREVGLAGVGESGSGSVSGVVDRAVGAVPEVDELREPPTERRLARAGRLRTRALQEAVASDPVASLRVAVVSLLAAGPSAGVRFDARALERRPEAPPTVARGLAALAHALGFAGVEALLDFEAPGRPGEREMYHRLLATPRQVLVRMFAALVAATVDAGSAWGGEPTVESPGLACEVAEDLEVAVTDWKPSVKYFSEYSLEEIRSVAERLGVELPASVGKEGAIDRLLASERIGEYSPPELLFRPPVTEPGE